MAVIADASASSLREFITANIAPGSTIVSDAWKGYPPAMDGYDHEPLNISASGRPAHESLPAIHRTFSLVKRLLDGTYQGGGSHEHLQEYTCSGSTAATPATVAWSSWAPATSRRIQARDLPRPRAYLTPEDDLLRGAPVQHAPQARNTRRRTGRTAMATTRTTLSPPTTKPATPPHRRHWHQDGYPSRPIVRRRASGGVSVRDNVGAEGVLGLRFRLLMGVD